MAQLSPADRQRIIRTYAQTGNGLDTARRCGFSEATVRRVIAQARVTNKIELHARATQRGIREGRKGLRTCTRIVQRYLADCERDKDLEPQDVAKLVSAQAQATRGLCDVQQRHEQHALSRMSRRLKQAELELTQARTAALRGLGLSGLSDEELALIQTIMTQAAKRNGTEPTRSGDGGTGAATKPEPNDDSVGRVDPEGNTGV